MPTLPVICAVVALVTLQPASGTDAVIVLRDGTSVRMKSVAFFEGGLSGAESAGLPVQMGKSTGTAVATKYVLTETRPGYPPVQVTYIPWSRITRIEVLTGKGPDQFSHPVRVSLTDGATISATNGPKERVHDVVVSHHNSSIHVSKILTITPTSVAALTKAAGSPSIESLIVSLKSEQFGVRLDAANALAAMGSKATEAGEPLAFMVGNDQNRRTSRELRRTSTDKHRDSD